MQPRRGRAVISDGKGVLELDEIVVAAPAAGEVRVRLLAAGLCRTDRASLSWGVPLVVGHEGAGVVDEVGADIENLKAGDPVVLNWAIPCGACRQCRAERSNLCERSLGLDPARLGSSAAHDGSTLWRGGPIKRAFNLGTFADYTLVRREAVTPVPRDLAPELACLLGCGVMTGVGAVFNVAKIAPDDQVVVLGVGVLGLAAVQGCRLAGARRIIAVDTRPDRLLTAVQLGATDTLLADAEDTDGAKLRGQVLALTDGRGADVAFEATGAPGAAFLPLRLLRNAGLAVQMSGFHSEVSVGLDAFCWDKRYVTTLYGGCLPPRDFPRVFGWVQSGALRLDDPAPWFYPLEGVGKAMADTAAGLCTKSVIRLHGGAGVQNT